MIAEQFQRITGLKCVRRDASFLRVAVLAVAVALAACGRAPSDADIKQSVEQFMNHDNGRLVGADEPYVNLDRSCSSLGQKAGRAEFQRVDRIVEMVGPKKEMAQGLFHWYAKTVWPVKVALRLLCQGGASTAPATATQDFELEYDGNSASWKVDSSYWSPWAEDPSEQDVIDWELYTALISGLAVGFVAAAARRPDLELGGIALGALSGLSAGLFVTVFLGIYVGLRYRILGDDGSPGFESAFGYGFIGLFIGIIGGLVGGCVGGLSGSVLGRKL